MTLVDHMLSIYKALALKSYSVITYKVKTGLKRWLSRRPEFGSEHQHGDSQSSDLCRPCIHIVYIYTLRYIHIELRRYLKSKGYISFNIFLKNIILLILLECVLAWRFTNMPQPMLRSEDNLWGTVFPSHLVGPGNRTQVTRLDGKPCCPMSHLDDLLSWCLIQPNGILWSLTQKRVLPYYCLFLSIVKATMYHLNEF